MLHTFDISNSEFWYIKYFKYKLLKFAPFGCKDIGIRKLKFVARKIIYPTNVKTDDRTDWANLF